MNWLGYREEEVWQLTPRKWNDLVSVHVDLENQKWGGKSTRTNQSNVPTGYIDQLGI